MRLDLTYQVAPRATMATPNTVNSTVPMPPVSGRVTPLLFSTVMTGTVVPCALALFTFQDSRMPVFSSYVAEMVTVIGSFSRL